MVTDERDARTYAIIGAAMEVHNRLGPGYHEPIYQDALEIEFQERGIPYRCEVELEVMYKWRVLAHKYRADFLCLGDAMGRVVVETKALDEMGGKEEAQLLNYLKGTKTQTGLLLNFGGERLEYKRMVWSEPKTRSSAPSMDSSGNDD